MLSFEQSLLKFVSPRLKAFGYEYDDVLRDRDLIYGFHKHLGNDIRALIFFQRHQDEEHAVGYDFTVELTRRKAANIAQWYPGGYEGGLRQRLGQVLRYSYNLQIYSSPDHWWSPRTPKELETAFNDAVDKLEKYGIPWLEDPQSSNPSDLLETQVSEFRKGLLNIVAPEFETLGYEIREDINRSLGPYFVKPLWDNLFALVVFNVWKRPDYPRLMFRALFLRRASAHPFEVNIPFHKASLELIELGNLMKRVYGLPGHESDIKKWKWQYDDYRELEGQLKDILDKIKRYAIPWLENPQSKNP